MNEQTTYSTAWRAKGLADGATSIEEMVMALSQEMSTLVEMRRDGVTLEGTVEDDYATLVTTDPEVAKRYGLDEEISKEEKKEEE